METSIGDYTINYQNLPRVSWDRTVIRKGDMVYLFLEKKGSDGYF